MMMLLKQLIESPRTSSKLLVYDPFRQPDQEDLVKEVIGLANANVEGARNIVFGINAGAIEGGGVVGISDDAIADLKKAHRLISALIEPVLHLAFIYDRINGKLVGSLEIDGCDDGPYIVGQNSSEKLTRGQCWVREDRTLRAVQPGELTPIDKPEPVRKAAKLRKPPSISVGFNEQPDCQLVEMAVPDTSNPPFAGQRNEDQQTSDLKKTIKEKIGTVTTQILRLGRVHKDESNEEETLFADADNHYYFEEKALKLNLSVCNNGDESVENVTIKLGFPRVPDFDVADRIYTSPFDKRSQYEVKKLGYPTVEHRDDAIIVRRTFDRLAPNSTEQAFKCALRLAVGPGMQRKKIAILYTLRGHDKQCIGEGRLKIKFGRSPT